jgi:hypothetical protein
VRTISVFGADAPRDVIHTFTPDDVLGRPANFVEDQRRRVISGLERQKTYQTVRAGWMLPQLLSVDLDQWGERFEHSLSRVRSHQHFSSERRYDEKK